MSNFQIGIIAVFVVLAVVGVLAFAGIGGIGGSKDEIGSIEIWGTISKNTVNELLDNINDVDDRFSGVKYVEKDAQTYYSEFVDALASGGGPDLFLLDHDEVVRNQDKIVEVPYKSFSERDFKNTFIEEGEIYLTSTGVLGLPFTVDPLVMYWNRNIFQNAGIANPPKFWDELFVLSPKITQRDSSSNIIRSFTALGEFDNVANAKDILSAFIMQSGNPIVASTERGLQSVLGEKFGFAEPPAEAAVRFYTEFSNPVKSVYSWNRSLPNSKQLFTAGDLAVYFGFASELPGIIRSNPNLNFDVSILPQLRDSDTRMTYGRMSAIAIPRSSKNPSAAFATALALTSAGSIASLSSISDLPPTRRDLLASEQTNAILSVFYNSAIISKAWLDPSSTDSSAIFKNMVESVTSGRANLSEAINTADAELNLLLNSR